MNKELEALEVLKQLKDFVLEFVKNGLDRRFIHGSFDIIENALEDYENTKLRLDETQTLSWQKEKKADAFDIIVNKDVEVGMLKGILHADKNLHTASYYNSYFVATYRHLTQKEFDMLKEELL